MKAVLKAEKTECAKAEPMAAETDKSSVLKLDIAKAVSKAVRLVAGLDFDLADSSVVSLAVPRDVSSVAYSVALLVSSMVVQKAEK